MLRNKVLTVLLLFMAFPVSAYAAELQKKTGAEKIVAPLDHIAAVVNDDVITRHELDERLGIVVRQLRNHLKSRFWNA